jgi:hypothetical protein
MNSTPSFQERQTKRRHQFQPKPFILPAWTPEVGKQLAADDCKRMAGFDEMVRPRNFTAKPIGPEFPPGPGLASRLMKEIERRETYIPPFNCARLSNSEADRLLDLPALGLAQIRDLGLPLFTAKDFEPSLFKNFSIVLWTNHGAYRHRDIQTFTRDKGHEAPWKITLNFTPLPVVASTTVKFWRVFDAQGRNLKRCSDHELCATAGDDLRFSYTINF